MLKIAFLAVASLLPLSAEAIAAVASPSAVGLHVEEALAKGGRVRVVVAFKRPANAGGHASSSTPKAARILGARNRVLSGVRPDQFDLTHGFSNLNGMVGWITSEGLARLVAKPDVLAIALDKRGTTLLNEARALSSINAAQALGLSGEGVTVAVLDTGYDTDHPDLVDDLVGEVCFCSDEVTGAGCCPLGNIIEVGPGSAEDGFGHGTLVSGIITSNGTVAPLGSAPDSKVFAAKVLDDQGGGWAGDILAGLDWIVTNRPDVNVVNMSIAADENWYEGDCDEANPTAELFAEAIDGLRDDNVLVFAAAGNDASGSRMRLPACISSAVSVGAVYDSNIGPKAYLVCSDASTMADQVACFSNSNASTDIFAPGSETISAWNDGSTSTPNVSSGTSMASPLAAGCAALMLENDPTLTPDEIELLLEASPSRVTDTTNGLSFPRVNCDHAINLGTVDPVPDLVSVVGIPTTAIVGTPFNVTVAATNSGFSSPEGAINASVLYSDGDDSVTVTGPVATWAESLVNKSPGESAFDHNCMPISAQDHFVEAVDWDWTQSESHSMGFTVTPQQSGTLYIQVRTTMKKSHGSPCDYVNDVSGSGGTIATDHQGWTVRQYTVTVQGGSFVHDSKSTADTSVSMEFPTARNGASNVMYVQYESGSSQQDSLVRFDLGSIPPGSDVTSAEIELHRQNSWDVNGAITLFAAQSTWSEGSLDWNNHPGYVLPSVESVPGVTGTILTWNSTNLVDLVQEWIDGATANNGLIIGGSQSGQFFVLHTKEQSGTSLDPSIHVEYSPPVCTTSYYLDADLDGYGDPGDVAIACSAPMGYVANNQDCDDSDSEQYPGSSEICNGEDDDCDLSVDEGSSLCDDAEFCNGIEVCSSGVCQPGTPPVCDDSLFCNGTETCNSGSCQAGTPPVCDDGLFCNGSESCDDQVGCQVGQPPVCDDGVFCNGPESCDDGLGCMDGPPPCPGADGDADCAESCDEGANTCIAFDPVGSACTDDGDEFTKDWCDGSGVCTHIPCSSGGPPAASKIAFAGKQAGNVEIYVVNADGSSCSPTNITNDPAHDGDPTWSPDGLQIAFASRRTGNHDIFVVNSDGTGGPPVNVSNDPGLDLMPSWSPNGGQIAFISERDGSPNVYVVNSDGSSSSPTNVSNTIGEPEVSFRPVAWSPNGDQIAFTAERTVGSIWNFEIYVVNSDGSSIAPINITDDPAQDINPAWSPDGGQIAFSSGMGEDTDIFVVNADGSGGSPTRITATASNIYTNFPSWSPDGTRIAFAAEIEDQAGDNDEIYVVNSDGSSIAPINITDDPAFDVDISWSPDSSQIAFSSERASVGINEFSEVFVVNADGNSATRLTNVVAFNTSSNWGPVWSPDLVPAPPVPALAAGRIFALVLFMIGIAVAAVADRKFKLRFPWVR